MRTAKKKKDKQGRTIGRGGDAGEALRKTSDLTLKDTSSFILFEFSVRGLFCFVGRCGMVDAKSVGGTSSDHVQLWNGKYGCKLLQET